MMGLMILAALAVYLVISVGVVRWAVRKATRLGKRGWVWGGVAAFAMYNLVFWDLIPTLVMHKYYCATEAGFWIYKTPEQWDAENPGVRESLPEENAKGSPSSYAEFENGHGIAHTYRLNEYFKWVVSQHDVSMLLPIIRTEEEVKDAKKNEILARYVGFSTGNAVKNTVGPPGPLKFWLSRKQCDGGGSGKDALSEFRTNFYGSKK